jgi:hypothetical protein
MCAHPDIHLSRPDGLGLKRGTEPFLAQFLRISLTLSRFSSSFSHKNINPRRSNGPNSNPTSGTWSTRVDLHFDRSFWGKSLNSYLLDFWAKSYKCEFNPKCSLGVWLFGTCLRLPKPWVLVWQSFGKFSLNPNFWVFRLSCVLCD